MKATVLVVEDEARSRRLLHDLIEAVDGEEALLRVEQELPDAILLDVMMPKLDGFSTCREIKRICNVPVIMLSARTEEYDKLFGFELGVDDYVSKPFSPKELMARIKVILERGKPVDKNTLRFDGLSVDVLGRTVTVDGVRANLTPKEIDLLIYLLSHPNIALSRRTLLQEVWGFDYYGEDRTVDTHIKMLRRNLGRYRERIVTVHGTGYKFET